MINNLRKLNILYVEDDDFIREHTTLLLKTIFKDVYTAKDGKDGILAYKQHYKEVDAIITDINMPYLSGLEMAKKINANCKLKRPIIAVSAYDCDDYGITEISENFSHYLRKPIQIKDLIKSIDKAIKGEVGDYCK
ncbi:response regulator [Malaciobacter mytili]|uniref:Response regulator n=1 Tax=Malaciobacter mytili LMG 24559 TaxID=1032238 RepID=A0AAX2AH48_9BACT|nr:response regulator [Malaciobacter mytili]AXH13695.1 signal transduction response regulator [Malaciobacter mytili LMG 24559]RXI45293.1 response regulator [Malaciobacter mytili]RXK16307.1 response regulator [Malaciobacter mytili LMG 24559]